jgi:RNA polymerase sigma-70 factor (ECF subfamily)
MGREMTCTFESFFRRAFPRVALVAGRIAGPAGGEDAAIEALARAFARWSRVSGMDNPEAWVMRVATNLAIDQIRRKPAYTNPTAEGDLQDKVINEQILRVSIAKLPRRQRQVVALRYLVDMPEEAVAKMLDVSPGAVKTHLHRALEQLRISLDVAEEGGTNVACP